MHSAQLINAQIMSRECLLIIYFLPDYLSHSLGSVERIFFFWGGAGGAPLKENHDRPNIHIFININS